MSVLNQIEHVVVVMMENRSFDNLLGWLYEPGKLPSRMVPASTPVGFDGLAFGNYGNVGQAGRVAISQPPTAWPGCPNPYCVPTPDPNEPFDHVTRQVFGSMAPRPGEKPNMSGFLADYESADGVTPQSAGQIMQTFGPSAAGVINDLARNFAVCDAWFASVPSQTWPNRAFVHTGSSDGHINNDDYELYDIETIFEVLQLTGHSWNVFHDTDYLPSLTLGQFLPRLWLHGDRFERLSGFKRRCRAAPDAAPDRKLPRYSFVEPRFQAELGWFRVHYPADYHPPHDVSRGELFLAEVYSAVRSCAYRDRILLVITFDEHGGCFDHSPPPGGAAPPAPGMVSRDARFSFDRYGVRVPAIVVSSFVTPGTVFRSPVEAPYDHASILATLRDWLGLKPFLPSPRIAKAPTLAGVLGNSPVANWPPIASQRRPPGDDATLDTPLSDVQRSLIASRLRHRDELLNHPLAMPEARRARTYRDAARVTAPKGRRWLWNLTGRI